MLGYLQDISLANLIQLNCQERKTAALALKYNDHQGELYFKDGNVVHAVFNGREGEEAAYELLSWQEGAFELKTGIEPPAVTINRGWSSLLIEGARRLDENPSNPDFLDSIFDIQSEDDFMPHKLEDLLKELSGEVDGYIASSIVGMDGIDIAHHARSKINTEAASAQMTMLFKLVDTSVSKNGHETLEDNVLTTSNVYVYTRYLPNKDYFLGVIADRKSASLGNLRLICKIYVDRIQKAMPGVG
ncbi:MAG: DUF4388 domain-containing protein [Anaerolineae bacterium]|nr:DUF4388 domain-containing protein [Anaerolineae bacterium]